MAQVIVVVLKVQLTCPWAERELRNDGLPMDVADQGRRRD